MVIYVVVILLCYLFYYLTSDIMHYKLFLKFIICIIGVFLCGGWMTGSDWRSYELEYYNSNFHTLLDNRMEVGYQFYASFFNSLGLNFWIFLISTKIAVYTIVLRFVKFHKVPAFFFLLLFLPSVGFYLFIDNPLRSFISLAFWFISLKYLYDGKLYPFILLTIIATLFHLTAIFMIPLYFLARIRIKGWAILLGFIAFNVLAYKLDYLFEKINFILNYSEVLGARMGGYLAENEFTSSSINVGTIHRLFFLILLLIFRRKIEGYNKFSKMAFNLAMISFLIYPFGMSIHVLQRFGLFVSPFVEICTFYALASILSSQYRNLLMSVLLSYSILRTILLVTEDYRYIPYTNYFVHLIKGDIPSYYQRTIYNYQKSPYHK